MKPSIQTLGQILYSPSQYVIPVFQRNYRWDRPQWEKLWTSLLDIQSPGKTGNHFMGFLVFVPGLAQPGQHTRFHLIDGQQRLTTSSLLMAALRNVARQHGQVELADEIHNYYLVHPLKKGEQHYRLLPKEHDQESYLALVSGNSEPTGRMADALEYFEQQLTAQVTNDPQALRRLFDLACQRLEFMCATLEAENAYNIFKSLNSTGVPLGPSDLIRNFVFMHVHPDEQDEFDAEYWAKLEVGFSDASGKLEEDRFSRFFRDVLMMDGRYVQPTETFATFESRHEATGFSPKGLASELLAIARDYAVVTGLDKDADAEVSAAMAGLNSLESSTTHPLLLSLFRRRANGQITSGQLTHGIRMLQGFILRRFVCAESSRGYGQMFVRAINLDADHPVVALEQYLLDRGWPHDALFVDSFSLFPLYKRGYAREVLEALERSRGHKEQAALSQAQIEHVMPQTLSAAWVDELGDDPERVHSDWLHRPGNLTLSAYNQEIGNQAFAVKRDRFADSNIGLTREIAKSAQWTEAEILGRGLEMAKQAAAIWTGPKDAHAADEVPLELKETRATRLAFWTGLAAHLAQRHPKLSALEPTHTRAIRLKSGVPNILIEVRYKVQEDMAALDVYFSKKAMALWSRLKDDPQHVNSHIGESWGFDAAPKGGYCWMTINREVADSDPSQWPTLYGWLGQKLDQVYSLLLPYLRAELMSANPPVKSDSPIEKAADGQWSEKKLQQQRFWGALAAVISQHSSTLSPHKPLPQHWTNYAIGRSGFSITPTVNSRDDRLGVELTVGSSKAKPQFQALLAQRDAIEAALGFPVEWQEMPDKIMSRIVCWREDSSPTDESRWPEYAQWMTERITAMEAVFRPLIKALP